jgi:hypothetical protein
MRATYNESADDRSGTAEPREVRRYPNRRMYDTRERRYVALDEIGRWIREGQHVRVVDVKTNEDVTVAVLLPIVTEELSMALTSEDGAARVHSLIRGGAALMVRSARDASTASPQLEPTRAKHELTIEERLTRLESIVFAPDPPKSPRG